MNDWIEVGDSLPEEGAIVLAWDGRNWLFGWCRDGEFDTDGIQELIATLDDSDDPIPRITHWMPLPEPPETTDPVEAIRKAGGA